MRKPRALRPGDRLAVVAPASAFARDEFEQGIAELRALGFEPIYEESVFERRGYLAGPADVRAAAFQRAWNDPTIAGLIAVRGGYGSVHLLPLLDEDAIRAHPKPFVGYSDNTSILAWLTTRLDMVSFHGPMLEGRLARGERGYDRDTFERCLCRTEPVGSIRHPSTEVLAHGEAAGVLMGGTLTQLLASLATPWAFDPPDGCVLFIDEVGERPYRLDRMLTQLKLTGLLRRASAIVFGELPRCDEPGGSVLVQTVIAEVLDGFPGPILFGLPSGHTNGATLTLPFGVRARVLAGAGAELIIDEPAVVS